MRTPGLAGYSNLSWFPPWSFRQPSRKSRATIFRVLVSLPMANHVIRRGVWSIMDTHYYARPRSFRPFLRCAENGATLSLMPTPLELHPPGGSDAVCRVRPVDCGEDRHYCFAGTLMEYSGMLGAIHFRLRLV